MLASFKHLLFFTVCALFTIPTNAQNQSSDFLPSQIISDNISAPARMAIDTLDNIYVVDAIHRNIVKYNSQGNYLTTITTDFRPTSIAINDSNLLFIGEEDTGNIFIVSENGDKTLFFSGTESPNSMVFGLNVLYITYGQEKRVVGIDMSGTIVTDFTFEQFVFLTGIAFDRLNNKILVAEHGGIGEDMERPGGCSICWSSYGPQTAIYIFDLNGNHENTIGFFGHEDGQFQRIQGITVGTCGNIYATDPYLGRVSVFDMDGNFITKFGTHGNNLGEFNLPSDIVFSSDNRAFISSLNKGSVDVFSVSFSLPTATITSIDKTICTGTTTDITVEFTGEAPWTFTYTRDDSNPLQLTANATPFSFPVNTEGLYKIDALTDGNSDIGACFTGSTRVTISTEPPTANIITTELIKCSDDEAGVEILFTGIAPWTFTYTIDGTNPTEITTHQTHYVLSVEQSGLYEFSDLSDAACTGASSLGSVSVSINPLPTASVNLNNNNTVYIDLGATANIEIFFTGSAPYTFTYVINETNVTSVTTSNNPYVLTLAEEGAYEITSVSDLYCNNNEPQDYFNIIYNAIPPTATLITSDFYLCQDETAALTIDFTGTAPWTFNYSIDGIEQGLLSTADSLYVLTTSLIGIYELSAVSDQNTSGTVSGTANVIALDIPVVDLPEELYMCDGDPAYVLDAGEHESYVWSDGSTNRTLEVSQPGIYGVTVTNASGCIASHETNVYLSPLPDAHFNYYDMNPLEVLFVNESINADSHYWDFGDGTYSTEEYPIHTFPAKGHYTVTYTAISNHCGTAVYSELIHVKNKPDTEVVLIFPNPSYGEFTVAITPNEPITELIEIFVHSLFGDTIYYGAFNPNNVPTNGDSLIIDISIGNYVTGVHIVSISAGDIIEQHQLLLH